MATADPFGVYSNQKTAISSTVQSAPPADGQPYYWNRIAQVGVGKSLISKIGEYAKQTVVSIGKSAGAAGSDIATGIYNDTVAKAAKLPKFGNPQKVPGLAGKIAVKSGATGSPKNTIGNAAQTALLALPGGGKAAQLTGEALLKTFGTQGVKDLAVKAGVDLGGKGVIEGAKELATTKIAQQAYKKASSDVVSRLARSSTKTAAGFGAYNAAGTLAQGGNTKQVIKSGVKGAEVGLVAGTAGSLLKSGVTAKLDKTPTITKATVPKEDVTPSPVTKLDQAAKNAKLDQQAKATANQQAKAALTPTKTKLLGPGSNIKAIGPGEGKAQGEGFTMSPEANPEAIAKQKQITKLQNRVTAFQQGKLKVAPEVAKADAVQLKQLKAAAGTRPKAELQSAIEKAHASGDTKLEAELSSRMSDKAMTAEAPALSSDAKAKLIAAARAKAGGGAGGKPMSVSKLKVVSSSGKPVPSQLSEKINARAVENKLTEDLGPALEHNAMNIPEQASKATDLINNDEQKATDVALGKRNAPAGIHPHAVFVAVEHKAIKDGNVDLLRQLSQSKRVDEATAAGQTLRILRERDDHSPVSVMQHIADARKAVAEKRLGRLVSPLVTQTAKEIESHIKAPTVSNWSDFVESIRC